MVAIFQNVYGFTDSADVCKFGTFAIPLDHYAALFSSMTGVDLDAGGLVQIGERVYNLERYYNNLNGFREGSDTLPRRFLEEPGTGAASESVCELDEMLDEYYEARGWDNNGNPTREILSDLGMDFAADNLEEIGLLGKPSPRGIPAVRGEKYKPKAF